MLCKKLGIVLLWINFSFPKTPCPPFPDRGKRGEDIESLSEVFLSCSMEDEQEYLI
jgi:hypothetical protein